MNRVRARGSALVEHKNVPSFCLSCSSASFPIPRLLLIQATSPAPLGAERKVASVAHEHATLLASQLASQRAYFADKLAELERSSAVAVSDIEEATAGVARAVADARSRVQARAHELADARLRHAEALSEMHRIVEAVCSLQPTLTALRQEQATLQDHAMLKDEGTRTAMKERDECIVALKQQVLDLRTHVDHHHRIARVSPERRRELQQGVMEVTPASKKDRRKPR